MVSPNTLVKNIIGVNSLSTDEAKLEMNAAGVCHLVITVRLHKRVSGFCPICGRKCSGYDSPQRKPFKRLSRWRAPDWNGVIVELECSRQRICCPEHGVLFEAVPWAFCGSRFTKDFDRIAAWMAREMPRSTVAALLRISWATVGRCVSRVKHELEPDPHVRFNNLVRIGIDETSYRKGHKYITVVVNHDTSEVVWATQKHGKEVLQAFLKMLTPEQRNSIRVVTGDGARWITDCVKEYLPNCERCVDPFHVVEWGNEALDEVRRQAYRDAEQKLKDLRQDCPKKRGRPVKDAEPTAADEAEKRVKALKGAKYALGKAPEHLTASQSARLEVIMVDDNRLFRAYRMKEKLRLLLKLPDVEQAEEELNGWLWWASHSRIPVFHDLYEKIKRHKEHILNTIRHGLSNARVEAVNNKIKLIIRKAYGFRNIENMLDMVLLVCSNMVIPLPNRGIWNAQCF